MKKPLLLLLVAAGGVVVWAVARFTAPEHDATTGAVTASGTVEATEARLGFQVGGRIEHIAVREGDAVVAGDELATLDRREMLARRDEAEARVASSKAALRELEAGFRIEEIAQARAARDAAREREADAVRDLDRTQRLYDGGAVSREAYDKAILAVEVSKSQLAEAEEHLRLLEAGPRREKKAVQRAQLAQARASVQVIDVSLENMRVVAPFDGTVSVRHREPGETVAPGAAVLTLMNPDDRWVRIYVRENRIGAVKLGMPAEIVSDTYPEKIYRGRVRFISPEAEFTPKNVQTAEERVKLVYAVKVSIEGDTSLDLKPGMPADVTLEAPP